MVEIGFRLNDSGEVTTVTGKHSTIEESVICETINQPARHTHLIRTKTPDYLDKLVHTVMQGGTPRVQVRVGLVSGDRQLFLPWQEHQITYYKAFPTQDGHDIRLDTADGLFVASRPDQKVRARRGIVSEIVTSMIGEVGESALVEPTKSNGGEIYIQSMMDDITFITRRMIPRAINAKGRGNYRLFIKDNVVHFHTPDFQADVHQLDYFNRSSGTMLAFSDNSQGCLIHGSAGATAVIHDPYTGASQTIRHDDTRALNYAKVTPRLFEVQSGDQPIPLHVGSNRSDEIQALIQNIYETTYSSMYEVELKMERMLLVRLNDMIDIIIRPDQAKTSPWSGLYSVTKVEHTIVRGAMESKFTMHRGEQASQGRNFQGLRSLGIPDLVIKENLAKGQVVNAAEVQGSSETTLTTNTTERLSSGQVIKTVQAP